MSFGTFSTYQSFENNSNINLLQYLTSLNVSSFSASQIVLIYYGFYGSVKITRDGTYIASNVSGTTYIDADLSSNTSYTYVVTPTNSSGSSGGLYFTIYNGYFADSMTFTSTAALRTSGLLASSTGYNQTISSINAGTNGAVPNDSSLELFTVEWVGYFLANATGTWTFYTNTDDGSFLWIGSNATSGYTAENAIVNNGGEQGMTDVSGTVYLTSGTYYPIRILYGDSGGGDNCIVSFTPPSGTKTTNGTGYYFPTSINNNRGLYFTIYNGYFSDSMTFTSTAVLRTSGLLASSTGYNSNISSINAGTNNAVPSDYSLELFTVEWVGYFLANATGTWTFYTNTDDSSYLWIGSNATSGYTAVNANVFSTYVADASGTVSLVSGTYYPIRILYGDGNGDDRCIISFTPPSGTKTTNGSGYYFSVANGTITGTSLTITKITLPDAPTNVSATASNSTTISVSFTASTGTGGGTITYNVMSAGSSIGSGTSSPISITGLSSTTKYILSVTATNSSGTSWSSTIINPKFDTPAISTNSYTFIAIANRSTIIGWTFSSNNHTIITNGSNPWNNTETTFPTGTTQALSIQYDYSILLVGPVNIYQSITLIPGTYTIRFYARPRSEGELYYNSLQQITCSLNGSVTSAFIQGDTWTLFSFPAIISCEMSYVLLFVIDGGSGDTSISLTGITVELSSASTSVTTL